MFKDKKEERTHTDMQGLNNLKVHTLLLMQVLKQTLACVKVNLTSWKPEEDNTELEH